MKKALIVAVAIVCCLFTTEMKAQKVNKFGHVDFAALFELMPEREKMAASYEAFYKTIEGQLMTMQQEFQAKYTTYQQGSATMSDIIRETKEKELVDLQNRIEDFQVSGQKRLADKEAELMQPLIDKAKKAVEDVAKENGYTYIFNSTEGLLLYAEPSDNVMNLVKKKLGL